MPQFQPSPLIQRFGGMGYTGTEEQSPDTNFGVESASDFVVSSRRQEDPGFWDTVMAGMSLNPSVRATNGFSDWLSSFMDSTPEDTRPFDMAAEIRRMQPNRLALVNQLAEDGYLSESMSRRDFYRVVDDAAGVLEDQQTIARYAETAPWYASLGAGGVSALTEPIFMVPVGGQAMRAVGTARGAITQVLISGSKNAAVLGGINLAAKKTTDTFSYDLTNQDGLTDEMVVVGLGAGLGMAMPATSYAAKELTARTVLALGGSPTTGLRGATASWARSWTAPKRLNLMLKNLPEQKIVSARGVALGEGGDAAAKLVGKAKWKDEQATGMRLVQNLLDDARNGTFHEGVSIAPLRSDGGRDALEPLLKELRKLYRAHRKQMLQDEILHSTGAGPPPAMHPDAARLVEVLHPAQEMFDSLSRMERTLTKLLNTVPKTKGAAQRLVKLVADLGDALPTGSTPNARARVLPNWFSDLNRILVSSNMELTAAELAGTAASRSSAEAVKDGLDGVLRTTLNDVQEILRRNKMYSWMRGTSAEGRAALREAVDVIMDRRMADEGLASSITPGPRSAVAIDIADRLEKYFDQMYDELVDSGLLKNDPALKKSHYISLVLDDTLIAKNRDGARAALIAQFRMQDRGNLRFDAVAAAFDRARNNPVIREQITDALRAHYGDPTLTFKNGNAIRKLLEDPSAATFVIPSLSSFSAEAQIAITDSLERIYQKGSDDLILKLTDPYKGATMFDQVAQASNVSVTRERTFVSVGPALREFIVKDPITLLRRYRAQVHGQIGIARAIKAHPDVMARILITDQETGSVRPVKNAGDLIQFLGQLRNDVERFSQEVSANSPGLAKEANAFVADANSWILDSEAVTKRLIGQILFDKQAAPSEWTMWTSRQLSRWSVLVNGGMMGYSNLLDMTTKMYWSTLNPRGFQFLANALLPFDWVPGGKASREMLEMLNMGTQVTRLLREDTEFVLEQRAAGSSPMTRTVTAAVDRSMESAAAKTGDIIGLNFVNNFNARWGSLIAMHEMMLGAKKLVRGETLPATQLGRLNRMGINGSNARQFLEQTHKFGVYADGSSIGAGSFNDFLNSRRPINPLWDRWDPNASDLRRVLSDNLPIESRRYWNVTPGVGDRPLWEDTAPLMRLVNQFSAFITAYNTQRLRPMAQMGGLALGGLVGYQFLMGWLGRSTSLDLTNRRSFTDSLRNLSENPHEEVFGAVQQNAMMGSLTRALGYMDNFNIGPSRALGIRYPGGTFGSIARQASDRQMSMAERAFSLVGAGPQTLARMGDAIYTRDDNPERSRYLLQQSLPYQNLIWARMLHRSGVTQPLTDSETYVPFITPSDAFRPAQRPTFKTK
jgi:hypothetical protein